MAPAAKPINTKTMSTPRLLALTEQLGKELAHRIDELQEGQRNLGIEGLKLQSDGLMRVVVKYPSYPKGYAYNVPNNAEVGDLIRNDSTGSLGTIVELGHNGYDGDVKTIETIYKAAG